MSRSNPVRNVDRSTADGAGVVALQQTARGVPRPGGVGMGVGIKTPQLKGVRAHLSGLQMQLHGSAAIIRQGQGLIDDHIGDGVIRRGERGPRRQRHFDKRRAWNNRLAVDAVVGQIGRRVHLQLRFKQALARFEHSGLHAPP